MKAYLRLLYLVSPIYKTIIVYFITVVLAILFSSINITLLIPLLDTIFEVKEYAVVSKATKVMSLPDMSLGISNPKDYFYSVLNYTLTNYGKFTALIYICIIIFASNLLANIFTYLSRLIMEKLRVRVLFTLRNVIFGKIVNLDIKYFNNASKGSLISLASSDIGIIQGSLIKIIELLSSDLLRIVAYIVVLLVISTKLTLFALIVIPIAVIIISSISKNLKKRTIDIQNVHDSMISLLENMIYGIKVVKAFNASDFIAQRYYKCNSLYSRLNLKVAKRQLLASPISENLFLLTALMLILYGGSLIFSNNATESFSAAGFITYLVVFIQLIMPLKTTVSSITTIYTGLAAGERIFNLIDKPIEVHCDNTLKEVPKLQDKISFKNVHFSYIKNIQVLKGVSFDIPKSKITAIVGPSGAGKSTITELLLRFYDIDKGEILFDNKNIKDLNLNSLRNRISIVSQEPILFNDTIFNNISFGIENASYKQVEYAAKMANIHDFILDTEEGYKTVVGDRGIKLSGGQKQRLGIARAVCHNPDILILDEATSALDAHNEKVVQEALEKVMKTCTSVVIAHRLSTIKNADNIVVMESGRVIESGNHNELMNNDGLYRKFIELQSFN